MTTSSNADHLAQGIENAAEVLEKFGWIRGSLGSSAGYCVIGALQLAMMQAGCAFNAFDAAEKVQRHLQLPEHRRVEPLNPNHPVAEWNDNVCSSKEEAIDALIGTAKELRNA